MSKRARDNKKEARKNTRYNRNLLKAVKFWREHFTYKSSKTLPNGDILVSYKCKIPFAAPENWTYWKGTLQ